MPLYEYQCDVCGRFERIVKFSDPPLAACPTCNGKVQKLFSSPAIQFKGSGFYITDYAKKPSSDSSGGKSSGEQSSDTSSAEQSSRDKSSDEKSSGEKSASDKSSSDKSSSDKASSDKSSGDKSSGDSSTKASPAAGTSSKD